jgi:hypothetical protein
MYIYRTDVLESIFEIDESRFSIEIKTNRHSDCEVVFVPEAVLITNTSKSSKESEIEYEKDQYWSFYYDRNTMDPNSWDFGKLTGVEVGSTSNKPLTEEHKQLVFERYYRFLTNIKQELYERDAVKDCINQNPLEEVLRKQMIEQENERTNMKFFEQISNEGKGIL